MPIKIVIKYNDIFAWEIVEMCSLEILHLQTAQSLRLSGSRAEDGNERGLSDSSTPSILDCNIFIEGWKCKDEEDSCW